MEALSKKRTFFSKLGLTREKALFQPSLRHFVEESRKYQTLYANCEGSYSRRVVNLNDKSTLENFVYCTMYYNGVHSRHNEQDSLKCEHVEKISDQMINISKEFDLEGKIHFGVIWVYYFCYDDKTQKATPVFKIFRSVAQNEAVYLDTSLTSYQSWDNYLDCAEFPLSFLCFPRNGEYCFLDVDNGENTNLDLEFFFKKRLMPSKEHRFYALWNTGFVPFCQVAIHPLLIKIRDFTAEKMRQVNQIICTLWTHKSNFKCSMFNAVVFGSLVLLKMKESKVTMGKGLETLLLEGLMLLNSDLRGSSWESSLSSSDFWSKFPTTSVPGFHNFSDDQQEFKELHSEAVYLKELLKKPRKDWVQILGSVCLLFKRGRLFLNYFSYFIPLPGVLQTIVFLLNSLYCAEVAGAFSNGEKSNSGSGITESQEVKGDVSLILGHCISNSQPNKDQRIEGFQSPKRYEDTDTALKVINKMTLEKIFSNLFLLETESAAKAQNRLAQQSEFELREKELPLGPLDVSSIIFLEEKDGYGIFFMPRTSLLQLTSGVSQLIGEGFSFKPEKNNTFNIILSSGKLAGTLFFPLEFSAIGVFSLETVRKKSKLKPLELTGSR